MGETKIPAETRRRMRQYLIFRLLVAVLGFLLTAFHIACLAPETPDSLVAFLYATLTAHFSLAVFLRVTFGRWQSKRWAYAMQAPLDLVLLGALIWATGGVASVLGPVLFVTLAAATGISTPRGAAGLATLAAAVLAVSTIAHANGLGPAESFWADWTLVEEKSGFITAFLFANVLGLYVIGSLGSKLSHGLRDSEELQGAITEAIGEGLIAIDRRGQILRLNRGAQNLLGVQIELEQHSHLLLRELLLSPRDSGGHEASPDGREELVEAFCDRSRSRFETTLVGADGYARPVLVRLSTVTDEKGRVRCRVGVLSDLTLEREVAAAERRIENLEELQVMALGIAHEIRNPLASIRGCVQEIARAVPAKDSSRSLFRIVLAESDRLDRIVEEFLRYARSRRGQAEKIDLLSVIEETVLLLRQRGDVGNREIVWERPLGCVSVRADPQRLLQVFLNLGLNAFEATHPETGRIEITIASRPFEDGDPKPHRSGGLGWRGGVEVIFRDNGYGIPEAEIERLFTPFYTTKSTGVGLGLSIVERIVREHGGWIDVQSKVGEGSSFAVRLGVEAETVRETPCGVPAEESLVSTVAT